MSQQLIFSNQEQPHDDFFKEAQKSDVKYMCIRDDDKTILRSDMQDVIINLLETNPKIGLVYGDRYIYEQLYSYCLYSKSYDMKQFPQSLDTPFIVRNLDIENDNLTDYIEKLARNYIFIHIAEPIFTKEYE